MISRVGLIKRKEGMSMEEFGKYWHDVHAPIACQMPTLRHYSQNVVVDNEQRSPMGRGSIEIDGYSELVFDTIGDMNRDIATLNGAADADMANFAEPNTRVLVFAKKVDKRVPDEYKGKKLIKRMSFLGRLPGVSAERWKQEWWELHSELVGRVPGALGYNQNLVIDRMINGHHVPYEKIPVQGMVEFWFEDMNAFKSFYEQPEFKDCIAHGPDFITDITTYLVEETFHPTAGAEK